MQNYLRFYCKNICYFEGKSANFGGRVFAIMNILRIIQAVFCIENRANVENGKIL